MKTDATTRIGPEPDSKNGSEPAPPPRIHRGKRRSAQAPSSAGSVRFFLSKTEDNGVPTLDREFVNEPEAIIESLKTGKSYFVISEWKGLADLSKKMPLIRKESINSNKRGLD